ncbi:hypothetical protein BGW42_001225 [Actinomortierella wolfii]|nr:hypothetical protein BGW42_001225 [Actinomortierella wolfii]
MHRVIDTSDLPYEVPPLGMTTIGEENAELVHVSSTSDLQYTAFIKNHGDLHPALQIPKAHAGLNTSSQKPKYEDMPLSERLLKQPLKELLKDYASKYYMEHAPEPLVRFIEKANERRQSTATHKALDEVLDEKVMAGCIIAIAMHPHLPLMAVALAIDSVWVYDLSQDKWYSAGMSHQQQTKVATLEWKPMSGVILAVGCNEGVKLWSVYKDPDAAQEALASAGAADFDATESTKKPPSQILSESLNLPSRATNHGKDSAWMDPLSFPGMPSIDFISWDPLGEQFAAASIEKSKVFIHDMATRRTTSIGSGPGPVSALKWSPAGDRLLVAYLNGEARIYSTVTWEYVTLDDGFEGPIQTACWTPDGFNLIYALRHSNVLRAAHFEQRSGGLTWTALNYLSMVVPGVKKCIPRLRREEPDERPMFPPRPRSKSPSLHINDKTKEPQVEPICMIREVALDPVGERLVVRFKHTELLAVVVVRPTGRMLRDLDFFQLMGFIRGPSWNPKQKMYVDPLVKYSEYFSTLEPSPLTIAFSNQKEKQGTLLAVVIFL